MNWDEWSGPIERSRHLTARGRQVVGAAAAYLERFLGVDFVQRARERRHPFVSHFWWPENDVPQVYVRLLELFTRSTLLTGSTGFGRLRRSLQQNMEPAYWHHASLALELGGLALRAGYEVEFEPQLDDARRADLRLTSGGEVILVESLSVGVDTMTQTAERFSKKVLAHMLATEVKHSVDCTGVLMNAVDDETLSQWLDRMDAAAAAVAGGAPPQRIAHEVGGEIVVRRTPPGAGTPKLQGPRTGGNEWARVAARIADKARQTTAAQNLWLRMDELGGLWHFTPWSMMSLQDKLTSLLPPAQEAIRPHAHISGLLMSNAWDYRAPAAQDERHELAEGGVALRRALPVAVYRETMLVARGPSVATGLSTLSAWYAEEPTWLDWALQQAGQSRLAELLILE